MADRPQRPQRPQTNSQQQKAVKKQASQEHLDKSNEVPIEENKQTTSRKSNGNKTKVILIVVISIIVLILLGVGYYFLSTGLNDARVVDLNNKVLMLETTVKSKDQKIQELNQAVTDTTVKEVVPETSLQRVEGSEVPELWLIDGDFIAPNKLEIPTIKDDINNSNMQIGSRFKIKPSENWLMSMQGTTIEFSHPTKIWGKVRALSHTERVMEADMRQIVQNFFIGYPATTITYRKLFIEDMVVGTMGNADITVKDIELGTEKEMTVNVGFAQRGDYTLSFLFVNDEENAVAQELIDLLLTSITFGESKLKLE